METDERIGRLSLARKVELLSGRDNWSLPPAEEIGLAAIVMADGPNGVRFGSPFDERHPAPVVPNASALAATWNEALVEEIGALLGASARAFGVHVLLAPTVNMHRTPLAGRNFECYSEDPLLAGLLAAAFVRGVQGTGVAATVKHVVCNDAETNRDSGSSELDERTLRELYLRPFELAIAGGKPWAVMSGYNRMRGTFMAEHPVLDQLRDELGFDGVVISDWSGVKSTAPTALGGLDIEMPGPPKYWGEKLLAAVESGEVPEARLDEKLTRLLELARRVAALHAEPRPQSLQPESTLPRRAAAESFVLLRNEGGLLPLAGVGRIAVLGPLAARPETQGGGAANLQPQHVSSLLDALPAALGDGVELVFEPGYEPAILPRLDLGWLDGGGFTVDYLDPADPDGEPLATEHRASDRYLMSQTPVGGRPSEVVIRMRATLTPPLDGTYTFGLTCSGAATLDVNGSRLFEVDADHDIDHFDVFAGRLRGRGTVDLVAGQPVPFELVFRGKRA
ncbi:MAG: beta-glucosidase, partial [Gaiellaceae bacterium]|nr:beta-glucosidase [Gaiellaceae bacterium]